MNGNVDLTFEHSYIFSNILVLFYNSAQIRKFIYETGNNLLL